MAFIVSTYPRQSINLEKVNPFHHLIRINKFFDAISKMSSVRFFFQETQVCAVAFFIPKKSHKQIKFVCSVLVLGRFCGLHFASQITFNHSTSHTKKSTLNNLLDRPWLVFLCDLLFSKFEIEAFASMAVFFVILSFPCCSHNEAGWRQEITRPFHIFRASRSGYRRILCSSGT